MVEKMKYSDHFDTIIALISHLSMCKYDSRTLPNLSKDIGINNNEVEKVVNGFPGIFRKSINVSRSGEAYYTLQMRYARRWRGMIDEDEINEDPKAEESPFVEDEYISLLFEFVTNMVNQEKEDWRNRLTNTFTIVASLIAFIASIIALVANIA
jgi:hypothetical protein